MPKFLMFQASCKNYFMGVKNDHITVASVYGTSSNISPEKAIASLVTCMRLLEEFLLNGEVCWIRESL